MKTRIFPLAGLLLLALILSACGPLWQVNPLPAGTPTASVTPNVVSPTVSSTPLLPTGTPTPPTVTPAALPVVPSPVIMFIDMLDEMNGWAIGEAYVLRTMDGGATWLNATPAGLASVGFSATSFFMNAATAWLILPSADYTRGALYHTANGGMTAIPSTVFYLSQDGGTSWTPTFPVNMAGRYAIANLRDIWVWDGGATCWTFGVRAQSWAGSLRWPSRRASG